MGSNSIQIWQVFIWVIILLITPLFGVGLNIILNLINGRDIPSILPQLNIQSFGQAFLAIVVLGIIYHTTKTIFLILEAILITGLFFILLIQAFIDKRELDETRKHVRKVLKDKLDSKLQGEMDLMTLFDLADSIIDADYFPSSKTNQLSGYPRRERRKQFITIILANLDENEGKKIKLKEKDLRVPPNQAKGLNRLYLGVSIASVFFYIAIILLSVLGQIL